MTQNFLGDARDYVKAMWKILQHKKPDDFVIATGKSYSVRQFVELSFFPSWNKDILER